MTSLTYNTKTTTLSTLLVITMAVVTVIEAYRSGPPVDKYPEICQSMSPLIGHYYARPKSSPPPFEIRSLTTNDCYKAGEPVTVQVKSINEATFFEGLFLQARTVHSDSYDTGTFDVMGDSELEVLNCGNSTTDNSVGQRVARQYVEKKFNWIPSADHGDVRFVASIVHETADYWLNVTSPRLRYDVNCVISSAAATTSVVTAVFSQLLLVLASPLLIGL